MGNDTLRSFKARNILVKCTVTDCYKRRFDISRYCARHHEDRVNYGAPGARRLMQSELEPYMKIARRIIKAAQGTPALGEALITIVGCISPGDPVWGPDPGKRREKMYRELQRLADAEVSPGDALIAATGTFLYLQANPRVLPKSDIENRATEFALARSILNLAPLRGTWVPTNYLNEASVKHTADLPSTVLAQLGKRILTELAPFFTNVARVVKQAQTREQHRINALRSPLMADAIEQDEKERQLA
jgi:hypothetical protein